MLSMEKLIKACAACALFVLVLAILGCTAEDRGTSQPSAATGTESSAADTIPPPGSLTYPIVDTNQNVCFDDNIALSVMPEPGDEYYGQDGNYSGLQPSYTLSTDGKIVTDNVTGLVWQRSPNLTLTTPTPSDKMTWEEAQNYPAQLNAMNYGGYSDWRLPTIKELYSLIQFDGTDTGDMYGDTASLTPFIDTDYFMFAYGDTASGERVIDSQYLSSTTFVLNPCQYDTQLQFGVNFADGRIKGYGLTMGQVNQGKTFYVICVRGNTSYGINDFADNGDGTVTDSATGLMWTQGDSGIGMTWAQALAWVQQMNEQNYLGYSDWRLPNAKELQSIVDYGNAPLYNGLPAIDTDFFTCTAITNENGDSDYPYYWTGTTHQTNVPNRQNAAVYVAFGSALGYFNDFGWVDVHGAGCQRSDPKTSPEAIGTAITVNGVTGYYHGPQGDAIRSLNFVRLVRDAG